ncbi:hypothetical protein [Sphingomonas japonica]|uniref:Uncharacterized protein n=2 Tax=Sphingomonas japonica TaxID=511662 RepID=A0ABX0TZL8_9SPHN|nr:hypothetical protein [Sphingomonas japonica]NIJ22466.1 hypothetical protein [Sphingomonas japonica]
MRFSSPTLVEVVKTRARCSSAAYVTATMDPEIGYAVSLSAGRLLPNAERKVFGDLTQVKNGSLRLHMATDAGPLNETMALPLGRPWHLYDFDLASLNAALVGHVPNRQPIQFSLPLAWNGGPPILRNLGSVTLNFVAAEQHNGQPALRYRATGTSAAFTGGPIWLDARRGHILTVEWGTPNHAEYRDFTLRLHHVHHGANAWRRLLSGHLTHCPTGE